MFGLSSSLPASSLLLSGATEENFVKYLGKFPKYPRMTCGSTGLIMR
jgi:hypothetical protein